MILGSLAYPEIDRIDDLQAVLIDLQGDNDWWDAMPTRSPQRRTKSGGAPWRKAVVAALALHGLALTTTVLVRPQRASMISPGTGAMMQVTMLPAWPRPGERAAQFGTATADTRMTSTPGASTGAESIRSSPAAISETRPVPQPKSPSDPPPASRPDTLQHDGEAVADIPPSVPDPALDIWEHGVLEKLSALQRYPASAMRTGQQDTVMVRFVVDRAGQIMSTQIARSRGFASLDEEARNLVLRASPLPALPAGTEEEMQFVVPVAFSLHRAR